MKLLFQNFYFPFILNQNQQNKNVSCREFNFTQSYKKIRYIPKKNIFLLVKNKNLKNIFLQIFLKYIFYIIM